MPEIRDETQVEFVCASRVSELRCATFLQEGYFSIYTEGGKQWRYKARNEVLHEMSFQWTYREYESGDICVPRIYQYWQGCARYSSYRSRDTAAASGHPHKDARGRLSTPWSSRFPRPVYLRCWQYPPHHRTLKEGVNVSDVVNPLQPGD